MACCFDRTVAPSKTLKDAAVTRQCRRWAAHTTEAREAAGAARGQAVACLAGATIGRKTTLVTGGKTSVDHRNTAECRRPARRIRREAAEIRAATSRNRSTSSLAFSGDLRG